MHISFNIFEKIEHFKTILGKAFLCCAIGVASRMADPMQASKHFAAPLAAVDYSAAWVSSMKVRVLYILCSLRVKERLPSHRGSVDVVRRTQEDESATIWPDGATLRPSARNEIRRGRHALFRFVFLRV